MELKETTKPTKPEFTLTLSLEETIRLYKLFVWAENEGYKDAAEFHDLLNGFGANSNNYTQYLD